VKKTITFLSIILFNVIVCAQVPQKMSYQAVIRNSSNVLVPNKQVSMLISILLEKTPVYVEMQTATTNDNGLVSIEIGNGRVMSGSFKSIDWSAGAHYIKTETDPNGGNEFTIIGSSELLSVPYALFAGNGGNGEASSVFDDEHVSANKTWTSDKINAELELKANTLSLAKVATTGSFTDLINKPTTLAGYGITDGKTFLQMSGDATMTPEGVITIADEAINTVKIADGSIENEDLNKSTIPLSGFSVPKANISMGGYKLTNLAIPINFKDAANKKYVDDAILAGSSYEPVLSLDAAQNLSITGGNSVSLADLYQSLSIAGTILSISGPRDSHIDLAGILTGGTPTGGPLVRDASLTGNGLTGNALGIADNGVTSAKLSGVTTSGKTGQVLSSNGTGGFLWTDPATGSGGGITTVNASGGLSSLVNGGIVNIGINDGNLGLNKIAPIGAGTILGNNTSGSESPSAIPMSDLKAMLSLTKADVGLGNVQNVDQTDASNLLSGKIPAGRFGNATIPGTAIIGNGNPNEYLKGDGTWGTPAAGSSKASDVSVIPVAGVAGTNVQTALEGLKTLIDVNKTNLTSKMTGNTAITGATKTKITYDSKGLVTAGADATTADIAPVADKRYVTDAQLTLIGNTSGTNTGNQVASTVPVTTAGTLVASNVQAALEVLNNSIDVNKTDIAAKLTANTTALVGATKTKITYDEKGLVTAGADATTADIAPVADKRYVTDAQLTLIGNTSGTNTGNQIAGTVVVVPTTSLTSTTVQAALEELQGEITTADKGVTTVSITNNAGVSGVVTNPTTTPAIALTLGAITPASVNTGVVTATGLKITTGASNGYVLKSDNTGNASWQAASSSYKGMWSAATNAPSIANGVGSNGDYYVVSVAGTFGGITFTQGGQAVYNGTTSTWESISAVETDPMVKAINGLVKSDGTTITAAIAGTDYLKPNGSAAALTGWPVLNQNTTGNALSATTATTSTNIAGGTAGQLLYQSAPNTTSALAKALLTGDVLTWDVSGLPVWKTPVPAGITSVSVASFNGFSSTSGGTATAPVITLGTSVSGILKGNGTSMAAAVASDFPVLNQSTTGNATTATSITGGAAGLLYQSGPNTTSQILNSTATAGNILSWNGTIPVWQAPAVTGITSITSANGISATPSGSTVSISLGAISPTSVASGPISSSSTITATGLITASSLKITTGAMSGYVLKSDASGNATWNPAGSTYNGMWDASTNTPTLANGVGANGDYYVVSITGSPAALGGLTFTKGGQSVYNGTTNKWESISAVEADPLVKAINGMVKSDGNTIMKAVAGTDYLLPTGNAATSSALQTGRTISITGDVAYTSQPFNGSTNVTGAGTIANNAVTYAKMQAMTANKLLGSGSAGTAVSEITLGTNLSFTGSTLNAASGVSILSALNGITGSIAGSTLNLTLGAITPTSINTPGTVTASGFTGPLSGNATTATTATSFSGSLSGDVSGTQGATVIGANKVGFGKIQAITPYRLLGAGSGTAVSEITLGTNLTLSAAGILDATGGSGGVTAVTANNGTSGSISGSTLTIGLGAITPTSINTPGTVTASGFTGPLTGNATTATTATTATSFTGALAGDVSGTQGATVIGSGKVTYGKMQAITTNKLLGSGQSGTAVSEITLGSGLSFTGSTLNTSIPTYTSTEAANVLTVNAAGTGLAWEAPSGGSVTPGPQTGPLYGTPVRPVTTAGTIGWTSTDVNVILLPGYSGDIVFPSASANKGRIVGINNRSGGIRGISNTTGGDTGIYGDEGWGQLSALVGMVCVISDGTSWRLFSGRP